ncbi:hypothetical protein ACWGQ2_15515 [Arthrobacter sp. NPDC055585]
MKTKSAGEPQRTLFRIENQQSMAGLWYDGDGRFTEYVKTLDHGQCRDLPMPFDPGLAGGWFSACSEVAQLQSWFSPEDLAQLARRGYGLYEIRVSEAECRETGGHFVFRRENALFRELPLTLLGVVPA